MCFSYLLIISLLSFFMMGLDKIRAKKVLHRIPEKLLFLLAFMGGAIGILIGMVTFHHKISKKKFVLGIPILYIMNKLVIWIVFYKYF
ncbi:DUF1294 domain-containing protein [Alkaliphilus serpentinus]|uniref:DUF1294 domain-containing protein n=1 Tax=Alkaliphilus serpentinus TaxID=1482731 RepID=A0A833M9L4_9FIRM|nr:DUF1294 domain-containing protein [Alkaliphilus serpentinus]